MAFYNYFSLFLHGTKTQIYQQIQLYFHRFISNAFASYDVLRYVTSFVKRHTDAIRYHQFVTYEPQIPSPLSQHRLSLVKRKILVLDLDETLIHSCSECSTNNVPYPADFVIQVTIERQLLGYFVYKRPFVDLFLDIVSQWYELVIYTASIEIYGSRVADKLDNDRGILNRRYYRQHCSHSTSYTKDISLVNGDLSNVFMIDNSPTAYKDFPNNAIPIESWYFDKSDTALLSLLPVLDALRFTNDVRSILGRNNMR